MKYPNGITKLSSNSISYGNRGMNFEAEINITNEYYLIENTAIIYKKPIFSNQCFTEIHII